MKIILVCLMQMICRKLFLQNTKNERILKSRSYNNYITVLQLQERIGSDIADVLEKVLSTDNIIVVIEGEHSCMTTRGIKSRGSKTKTATLRGIFKNEIAVRNEFY